MLLTVRQVGAEKLSHAGGIFGSPLGEDQQHVKINRLRLLQDKHKQDGRIGIVNPRQVETTEIPQMSFLPSCSYLPCSKWRRKVFQ